MGRLSAAAALAVSSFAALGVATVGATCEHALPRGPVPLNVLNDAFPTIQYCLVRGSYMATTRSLCETAFAGYWATRPSYLAKAEAEDLSLAEVYECEAARLYEQMADDEGMKRVWVVQYAEGSALTEKLGAINEIAMAHRVVDFHASSAPLARFVGTSGAAATLLADADVVHLLPLANELLVSPDLVDISALPESEAAHYDRPDDAEAEAFSLSDAADAPPPGAGWDGAWHDVSRTVLGVAGAEAAAEEDAVTGVARKPRYSLVGTFSDAVSSLLPAGPSLRGQQQQRRRLNDQATAYIQSGGSVHVLWNKGLTGAGHVIGIADSGIDTQSCFFRDSGEDVVFTENEPSPPFFASTTHRKIRRYIGFADEVEGESGGHGTHVAGSLAGRIEGGSLEDAGNAYSAKLSFVDIGNPGQPFLVLPVFIDSTILQSAHNDMARVHSHSWGTNSNSYTGFSFDVDKFTYENQDALVLFAAGNSGQDDFGDVVPGSVGAPATAKNLIAVGAGAKSSSGAALAGFSSRGPTYDGRIAPTVVGPGVSIQSANSATIAVDTCSTTFLSGTSMACPTVASAAVLAREYFLRGFYPTGVEVAADAMAPLGSLVKGLIVASGQGPSVPDNDVGFGTVLMSAALSFADDGSALGATDRTLWVDGAFDDGCDDCPLFTQAGHSWTYGPFDITDPAVPFTVVLAYSDPPAAVSNTKALINDISLTVADKDGNPLGVNMLAPGLKDGTNNVERARADAPANGPYTVTLFAEVIAQDQPFSVVATGAFRRTAALFPDHAPVVDDCTFVSDTSVECSGSNLTPAAGTSVSVDVVCDGAAASVAVDSATDTLLEFTLSGLCPGPATITVSKAAAADGVDFLPFEAVVESTGSPNAPSTMPSSSMPPSSVAPTSPTPPPATAPPTPAPSFFCGDIDPTVCSTVPGCVRSGRFCVSANVPTPGPTVAPTAGPGTIEPTPSPDDGDGGGGTDTTAIVIIVVVVLFVGMAICAAVSCFCGICAWCCGASTSGASSALPPVAVAKPAYT